MIYAVHAPADEEPAAAVLLGDGSVVVTTLEVHRVAMSFEEE